jgi:hypothetical protein
MKRNYSQEILASQKQEIEQMKRWRQAQITNSNLALQTIRTKPQYGDMNHGMSIVQNSCLTKPKSTLKKGGKSGYNNINLALSLLLSAVIIDSSSFPFF